MTRPPGSVFRQVWCAEQYDSDRFGGRFGAYLEAQEVDLFCCLLGDGSGAVLDAGAGTGKLTLALLRRGRQVTSVDLSLEMIRIAGRKLAAEGRPGQFAITNLETLCFRDTVFESTLTSRVLMHLSDWRASLVELCRVTDRVLILDFPPRLSSAGLDAWIKRRFRRRAGGPRQAYRTFLVREVAQELKQHGFSVVAVRRGYFLPIRFHRWIDRPSLSRRIEWCFSRLGLARLFGAPVTLKAIRPQGPVNPATPAPCTSAR